jgi:hypothetical protein
MHNRMGVYPRRGHRVQSEDAIVERDARLCAREWLDRLLPPPETRHLFSQMRWLLSELADRCIAEALRLGETEDALDDRLSKADDIVFVAQMILTTSPSAESHAKAASNPGEYERETHTLWVRRDPKVAFRDGYESPEHFNCAVDELCETIAGYLSRPWLRHPFLDWVFADVLVTREVCTFGESVKERFLPGKRDMLLDIHHAYLETRGHYRKMLLADAKLKLRRAVGLFICLGVAPPCFALGAFLAGQEPLGRWILTIYVPLIVVYIASKTVGLAIRLGRRLIGKPAPEPPHLRVLRLLEEMYEVWQRLTPPTVNPVRLKEALSASEKSGAFWKPEIWALVDRAIQADRSAWIVQRTS